MNLELLYLPGCLNVDQARSNLRSACEQLSIPAVWREYNLEAPDVPPAYKEYGSPTILVNGKDVSPATPSGGG